MDGLDFKSEIDHAIQYAIRIYRENAKSIKDMDSRGASMAERIQGVFTAYRQRSREEFKTEECDMLIFLVLNKMFGTSYALDSFIAKALGKQIPDITRNRTYGVREETRYLKDTAELKVQQAFRDCVLPEVLTDITEASVRPATLDLIALCDKTAAFLTKNTKGLDSGSESSENEGLTATEKEEIAMLTGVRMAEVIKFKNTQEEAKLALMSGDDE